MEELDPAIVQAQLVQHMFRQSRFSRKPLLVSGKFGNKCWSIALTNIGPLGLQSQKTNTMLV
eukprot:1139037-Pelagomonas_calceolata.AAC.1